MIFTHIVAPAGVIVLLAWLADRPARWADLDLLDRVLAPRTARQ